MSSARVLHLFATERHVERALREGKRAMTCDAFVRSVSADGPRRPAPPEVNRLAVALALDALRGELGFGPGYAQVPALVEMLATLRRMGAGARGLERAGSARGALLGRFLERTDTLLADAGLYDPSVAGFVAARAIEAAPKVDLPSAVVVDGLFDWDSATSAWVEALARRVDVVVRMPRASGYVVELAEATDALLGSLEARWHALPRAPELDLIEAPLPDEVTFLEAATPLAEARAIARIVRDALAAGEAPESVAVLVPSFDEAFLEPLRAAMAEASVEITEGYRRPAFGSGSVRAGLGWLDLANLLHRDALIDWLRTSAVDPAPFVPGPSLELRQRRALSLAARLERLPAGADRDRTLLIDLLSADVDRASSDEWMLEALEKLLRALTELAEPKTREEFAAMLVARWESFALADAPYRDLETLWASDPSSLRGHVLAGLVRDEALGIRSLVDATARVVGAAAALGRATDPVSAARFRFELEALLAESGPRTGRKVAAARIGSARDLSRIGADLLVVARGGEPPLDWSGRVVDELAESGAAPLMRASARAELVAALSAARRVVFTRAVSDGEGRAHTGPALFDRLAAGHSVVREPSSQVNAQASILSLRQFELVSLAGGNECDPDVARRASIERERLAFFFDLRRLPGPVSGSIDVGRSDLRTQIFEAFGGTAARPVAATAIERAASCRFAAFAARVLGASAEGSIGETLEPWQKGALVHRALAAAFDAMRAAGFHKSRSELESTAREAARRAVVRDPSSALFRAEVERALRDVDAVVAWSLDDDAGFLFLEGERPFGKAPANVTPATKKARAEGRTLPPLAIGAGNDTVYVGGRIDRIDASPDRTRVRIIDYKTGSLPAWKDVGTRVFQPPLYAYAVLCDMGRLSLSEVRALYLDTTKRPPRVLPAEERQVLSVSVIDEAQRNAADVVRRIWGGDIAPRPADAQVCGRCDVRDVCRRPAAIPVDELDPEAEGSGA